MADPTIIELIELRAKGIADIHMQIDRLKGSIDSAANAQIVYAKTLQDPVYQKNLRQVEQMKSANRDLLKLEQQRAQIGFKQQQGVDNVTNRARVYEELKAKQSLIAAERDLQRLQAAATTFRANSPLGMSDAVAKLQALKEQEAAQRAVTRNDLAAVSQRANSFAGLEDARAAVDMRQREERAKRLLQQNDLAAKTEAARTPQAVKDARQRLDIEKQVAALQKAERQNTLTARYGTLGGRAAMLGESRGFMMGAGLAGAGAAAVGASAMAGFSDTVEMNTLRTQLMFLNREIAGAFAPAMAEATAAVKILRFGFEGMTSTQQKLFAATTLAIGGLVAFNLMLNRSTGMGMIGWGGRGLSALNTASAASSMGQYGAFAGALGPGAAGAAGTGAAATFGLGSLASVLSGVAFTGFGMYQSGDRASDQFAQGNRSDAYKSLGSGLSNLNPVMAPLEFARRNLAPGYNPSWAAMTSPIGMLGEAGYESIFGDGIFTEKGKKAGMAGKGADGKSRVTPILPTLYSEAGGTYEEVALAVANKAAADNNGKDSTLGEFFEWAKKRFGDERPPNNPPPQ